MQWRESPNAVMAQSTAILDALSEATKKTEGSADSAFPNCTAAVDKCFRSLSASYDQKMGGFGRFPKFPQPGLVADCIWLNRYITRQNIIRDMRTVENSRTSEIDYCVEFVCFSCLPEVNNCC